MPRNLWLSLFLFSSTIGCDGTPAKQPASGASEKPKVEGDLAFTTITKKAYVSLAIQTQPATVREVHERLALTGWIMAKPGHEVTLTAPAAGYVQFRKDKNVPIAGELIEAHQELLMLEPVLSPVEQIQVAALKRSVESELVKADTTLKTAESDYTRIKDLHAQNLRSKQDFELAQKARDHAIEELAAAKDKLKLFQMPSIPIRAPLRGTILLAPISPGQYVPASAPLVTIIDLQPIWIRVPAPEFDLPLIDPKQSVAVTWKNPNQGPHDTPTFFTAKPTGRVAQVDPLKHTADLWYELEATKEADRFVKDQMVTVHVPIGKKEKASVVPYSAIVFDAHGHAWIYLERTSDKAVQHQFERRRVELVTSAEGGLIVRPTLSEGERVVTNGAAALFSREFHKTPVLIAGEDD